MTSTIIAQIIFVAMLIIHTDGHAQCISEPVIGETYFTNSRAISIPQKMHPQKFDLAPILELRPHWVFVLNNTPDPFLQIHNDLELWRSQNALRTFVLSQNNCRLPLFESTRSNFLLARWDGRIPNYTPTKILIGKNFGWTLRPAYDHFELVWSPEGFKLNRYQDKDNRVKKCTPSPPAVLTETIPLLVHSQQSNLVLRPNENVGLLPLFVILSNDGNAQVATNPNEGSKDPGTNEDYNWAYDFAGTFCSELNRE